MGPSKTNCRSVWPTEKFATLAKFFLDRLHSSATKETGDVYTQAMRETHVCFFVDKTMDSSKFLTVTFIKLWFFCVCNFVKLVLLKLLSRSSCNF